MSRVRFSASARIGTIAVAAMSLMASTGTGWSQGFTHPDDLKFPELNPVKTPEPDRFTLDNGMVVYLLEDRDFPIVEIRTLTRGGGLFDPASEVGLAEMTADVMRTGGIKGMSGDDLDEAIEAIGTTLGVSAAGRTFTGSMSTLSDKLDESMKLFVGMLRQPTFAEDKLDEARTGARTAIASRNDEPTPIALRELPKLLFGADSPYGRHTDYATIDAITVDKMKAEHARFFHPNTTMLIAWGDFKSSDMKKQIKKSFGDWKKSSAAAPEPPPLPKVATTGMYLAKKEGVNQSTVIIGNVSLRRDDPDYAAAKVLESVLSGGFGSRIVDEIRTKRGLAYATGAFVNAPLSVAGTAGAYVLTQADSTVTTIRLLQNELEKIRNEPPTDEEMKRAKDGLLNAFVFEFDTKSEVLMRRANFEMAGYPADFLDRYQDEVRAVTPEAVQKAAQRFYNPEQTVTLVVGPADSFAEPLTTLGKVTEVDITIPTPEIALEIPDATPESLAKGQELIAAAMKAHGGKKSIDSVKSLITVGTGAVSVQGMDLQIGFKSIFAAPKRLYGEQTVMGQTMTSVLTADGGWRNSPQGVQEMSGDELTEAWSNEIASGGVQFLMQAPKLEVQAIGEKEVDGVAYNVVHVRDYPELGLMLYINEESGLIERSEYQGKHPMTQAPVTQTSKMADFRDVNGIKIPYQTELLLDGEPFLTGTTSEITVNGDVDESLFAKPGS